MAEIDEKALEAAIFAFEKTFDTLVLGGSARGARYKTSVEAAIRAYEQARAPSPDVVEIVAGALRIDGHVTNYGRRNARRALAALQAAGHVIRKDGK